MADYEVMIMYSTKTKIFLCFANQVNYEVLVYLNGKNNILATLKFFPTPTPPLLVKKYFYVKRVSHTDDVTMFVSPMCTET